MHWFTSDLHLWHRLVSHLRGFGDSRETADVEAHNAEIQKHWDNTVKDNDTVWLLGDMIANGRHRDAMLEWISERPGTVNLILGNHDEAHPMHRRWVRELARYQEVFNVVQTLGCVRLEGRKVLMSHFPYGGLEGADRGLEPRYMEWRVPERGLWLLHGHTHMADQKLHGKQIHVGWDAWRRLVSSQEISRMIREAEES